MANLSIEHMAQVQAWLPAKNSFSWLFGGGSPSPSTWEEVYRATTHGFSAEAFHTRCDGRTRLLVLVWAREVGWLFGGFTAVGFKPPSKGNSVADPTAFLFSLTNSLGRPEKLTSKQTGMDLYYHPSSSAAFGSAPCDLYIGHNADERAVSFTNTGTAYAESASTGVHPMARGKQKGWLAAEVVAYAV